MKLNFNDTTLDISSSGKTFALTLDNKTIQAEILHSENGKLDLLIDGERVTAYVSSDNAKRWVTVNGQTFLLTKPAAGARNRGHGHHHTAGTFRVTVPMPGQVSVVNVSKGEKVMKGQTLLVLEAMKMEIRVQAPVDGVVSSITVKVGQTVEREQTLVKVESQTSDP